MKILKIITIILLLCIGCGLLIACNVSPKETQPAAKPTEADPTKKPTEAEPPTEKPTSKPTKPAIQEDPESDLPFYLDVPFEFNGRSFTEENIELGQDSYMHIISKRVVKDDYDTYLASLEDLGFVFYTDNQIGDNLFSTYITQTQIVNVMFLPTFEEVRVIEDSRVEFDLPGLESENVYEGVGDTSLTLVADGSVNWPGRMGYIYKLSDGSFVIIDGGATSWVPGCGSSADVIMNVLKKHADDPDNIRIAAWLITHIHEDHMGGFYDMSLSTKYTDKVTIEKLIYNQPSAEDAEKQDVGAHTHATLTEVCDLMEEAIENWQPEQIIKAHPGQVFYVRDLTMTVYYSQELLIETVNNITNHNTVSVVTKVEFEGKSALYLGDTVYDANQKVIGPLYGNSLKCDILQVAHHGYGDSCAQQIYSCADPSVVFWPVYAYHYFSSESYNPGVKDISTNAVLDQEHIKHYIHDEKCIIISNFDTMEGEEWDAVP